MSLTHLWITKVYSVSKGAVSVRVKVSEEMANPFPQRK